MMRHHSQTLTRVAGFTLMEMLVAIGLLSLLTTLVYMSFVPSLEATEEVSAQRGLYQRSRIVFSRMETELRGAFMGNYPASHKRGCQIDARECPYFFTGEDKGEFDQLTFTTIAGRPASRLQQADQLWIRYYVETDEETKVKRLIREERPVHEADYYDTKAREHVLFDHLERFDLRYIERGTTNSYANEWDSTRRLDEEQFEHLPRAVEISLRFGDGHGRTVDLSSLVTLPASRPLDEEQEGALP